MKPSDQALENLEYVECLERLCLMRFVIGTKDRVDTALIAPTLSLQPREHVGIQSKGQLLFASGH